MSAGALATLRPPALPGGRAGPSGHGPRSGQGSSPSPLFTASAAASALRGAQEPAGDEGRGGSAGSGTVSAFTRSRSLSVLLAGSLCWACWWQDRACERRPALSRRRACAVCWGGLVWKPPGCSSRTEEKAPPCPLLPVLLVITFCHLESELDVELNSG